MEVAASSPSQREVPAVQTADLVGSAEFARVREAEEEYWRALRRRSRRNAIGCMVLLMAALGLLWAFVLRPFTPSGPHRLSPAAVR